MRKNPLKKTLTGALLGGFAVFFFLTWVPAEELQTPAADPGRVLALEEFIQLSTLHDTEFEQILIDELTLKYEYDRQLPARDLILSVKHQHEFFLNQDRDSPDTTVGLSKLFPYTGTQATLEYEVGRSVSSDNESSSASFTIAQPIAQNAFGRSTRLLKKIVGLEVDVARYQIVEAYEDYLATIMTAYYTWYEDYENLLIGRSSYRENQKLLDNINERARQKVALPIDVNKVRIQVLSKKETLVELEEKYKNSLHVIERMIRYKAEEPLIPQEPSDRGAPAGDFGGEFTMFSQASRTFEILRKLEERSTLQVDRDADALLPSIDLLVGYELSGQKYDVRDNNDLLFAGVSVEWPFPDQVDRAEWEVSRILVDKRRLITTNTYYKLYTQLLNLYLQIEREKQLVDIAHEQIALADDILSDETENYSFGRVSLNDYIQAVNVRDSTLFSQVRHESQYKKLLVEWLRLNDQLVSAQDIRDQYPGAKPKTP